MKRFLIILAIVIVGADLYLILMARQGRFPSAFTAETGSAVAASSTDPSAANDFFSIGAVVPVRHVELRIGATGRIVDIPVNEGDIVQKDQVLVRLDNREQMTTLAETEATLHAAQAQLEKLKAGPLPQEIAIAESNVEIAQANLSRITEGTPDLNVTSLDMNVSRTVAEAELRRAEAELALLQSSAQAEDIAIAEANVARAQADLQRAQLALEATELRAPFAGTVASLDLEVGEQIGIPSPVVQIADLTEWQIVSQDLDELSVVNVQAGDKVAITFDAIPNLELLGTVTHIRPVGNYSRGSSTYSVIVKPDSVDSRVRWNMTTQLVFQPSQK